MLLFSAIYTSRIWCDCFCALQHLYALFDPVHGAHPQNLSPEDIDDLEHDFLTHLLQVLLLASCNTRSQDFPFLFLTSLCIVEKSFLCPSYTAADDGKEQFQDYDGRRNLCCVVCTVPFKSSHKSERVKGILED